MFIGIHIENEVVVEQTSDVRLMRGKINGMENCWWVALGGSILDVDSIDADEVGEATARDQYEFMTREK